MNSIMSVEQDTDILQPLIVSEWPLLRDIFTRDWPALSYLYYWIENAIKWKEKLPNLEHEIFCPQGKYERGVFFGISSFSTLTIVSFTFEDSKDLYFKCVTESARIPWSRDPMFIGTHEQYVVPTLSRALKHLQDFKVLEIEHEWIIGCYIKPAKDSTASDNLEIPEGYELKALDVSQVPLITSVYPHTTPDGFESMSNYFRILITLNRGLGLFTESNELVSWALHTQWNGVGMVQTVDNHKRKGFARIVVEALTKELAKEGIDATTFVVKENDISSKMFASLGWREFVTIHKFDTRHLKT